MNWRGRRSTWYQKPIFSSVLEIGYPTIEHNFANLAQLYYVYRIYGLEKMLRVVNAIPYDGNRVYYPSEYDRFTTEFKKVIGVTVEEVQREVPLWYQANAKIENYGDRYLSN